MLYEQKDNRLTTAAVEAELNTSSSGANTDRITALNIKRQSLTAQIRQLEAKTATNSRSKTVSSIQSVQEQQNRFAQLRAKKRQLLNEVTFLEEEQIKQEMELISTTTRLKDTLSKVEWLARQVEFIQGELKELDQQVNAYKDTIPNKVMNMQHLESKISGTTKELNQLTELVRNTEKDFKLSYYEKKQALRRKNALY